MPEAEGQLHTGTHDDVVGHARAGTEAAAVALRPILLTAVFIVGFIAATLAGLRFYYNSEMSGPLLRTPRTFPAPRLQQNPERDLRTLQDDQRRRLESYAWVDRSSGIARMPIAEAMRLLAERGEAAYAAPVQPERVPALGSRGGASGGPPSPDGRPGRVATPASDGRTP